MSKAVVIEAVESRRLFSGDAVDVAPLVAATPDLTAKARSVEYVRAFDDPVGTFHGRILVSWNKSAQSGFDGYRVFRSPDNKASFVQVADVAGASYLDNTLDTGSKYFYRVRPYTTDGGSQSSLGTVSAVTNLPPTTANVFNAEDGVIDVKGTNDVVSVTSFRFEWTLVSPGHAATKTKTVAADFEGGADLFPFAHTQIKNLNPARRYRLRVIAQNDLKEAEAFVATVRPMESPHEVQTQTLQDQTVRLRWNYNSQRVQKFLLEWTLDESHWTNNKLVAAGERSTVIKRLAPGETYIFRVSALVDDIQSNPAYP